MINPFNFFNHPFRTFAIAAALFGAWPTESFAQVAGAPQSLGDSVGRVGGFKQNEPSPQTQTAPTQPVSSPAMQNLQTSGKVALPVQPGKPVAAPVPLPYPRGAAMPSPTEVNLVNETLEQVAPLTPAEVLDLRRKLTQRKEALTENVSGRAPAKATTQIYNVDLSPGATPPVIRIEVSQGAIVSFLDAAGKPWPARVADNFAPRAMTVSQFTEHQLSIGTGSAVPINVSVAVALEGLPTAVTFSVISGQAKVDSQVMMMIPRYRDGIPPEVGALGGQPSLNSRDLVDFLLRTPPRASRALTVEGVPGVMAWQTSPTRMVIRSSNKVASGYFRGHQGVGDGTEVYEVPLSPQVSFIYQDRMVFARISGFVVGTFGGDK